MTDATFPLEASLRQTAVMVGDGVTTVFGPFVFKIFDIADVVVMRKDAGDVRFAADATAVIAKTSTDAWATFTATFTTAPPLTTSFYIEGDRLQSRSVAVTKGTGLDTDALDRELTKIGVVQQEHSRALARAFMAEPGITPPVLSASLAEGELLMLGPDKTLVAGPDGGAIASAAANALIAEEAAATAVAAAGGVISIGKVASKTLLKATDTTIYKTVMDEGSKYLWTWKTGDYTARIAADTDENTFLKANAIAASAGAWERVAPAVPETIATRMLKFSRYRARYATDQLAFEAMLVDAFATTSNAYGVTLDLEGCALTMTAPIDVSAVTGRTTNFKSVTITNGTLVCDNTGGGWTTTTVVRECTIAQFSNAVTMTSDTSGIEPGMCIVGAASSAIALGDGMPRESYVKSITSGTAIVISTYAYRIRTKFYNFKKFPYFLNFKGFTTLSRVKFTDLNFRCEGIASCIMLGQAGLDLAFVNLYALAVGDRFITDWGLNASGAEYTNLTAWSNDGSETRTSIGLTITDNDVKFANNRIINFRHSQVMHGGGYTIVKNHNWQGGSTAYIRQPAFVHTNPKPYTVYTGNYIDNGGIEISNENQSAGGQGFNDITIDGNIFTMSELADVASRYIILSIVGYDADTALKPIDGMSVTGNVFRRLLGSGGGVVAIPRVDAVVVYGAGGLDRDAIANFRWEQNTYRNITNKVSNPAKMSITKESGALTTTWVFDFVNRMPFDLKPKQISASPGGLIGTFVSGGAIAYPAYTTYLKTYAAAGDEFIMNWRTATAVYGTVTMTADANAS